MNDMLAARGGRIPLSDSAARHSLLKRWHWVLPTEILHPQPGRTAATLNSTRQQEVETGQEDEYCNFDANSLAQIEV